MNIASLLSSEFNLRPEHVANIVSLIDGGNTIPFIARYRKELTGSCDDQVLRELADRLIYLRNLEKRKAEVGESIASQDKLTEELKKAIDAAVTLAEVEDLYRPFRPKRRTRATIAREKGLGPLAELLMAQELRKGSLADIASPYVDAEKGVASWEDALNGACDILAEDMSDDAACRGRLRELMLREGKLVSKGVKTENSVYEMYNDYTEPVSKIPSHRILAVNRGEKEEFLRVSVELNDDSALYILYGRFVKTGSVTTDIVKNAAQDAWKRLIEPSVEREVRRPPHGTGERAGHRHVRPQPEAPPAAAAGEGQGDPRARPGVQDGLQDCRCGQNGQGPRHHRRLSDAAGKKKTEEAKRELKRLIAKHGVDAIAIGNGTASRESELFVAELISELDRPVGYVIVNEAGASVYSASKLGAEEFPDFDVTAAGVPSLSPGGSWTRWPSLSRSTRKQSASASTSTTCRRPGSMPP